MDGPATIEFVNPFPAAQPVKISDKFDGIDSTFQIVARVANAPAGAVAEATVKPASGHERTIGALRAVPGTGGTIWTLAWGIPDNVPKKAATMKVRLFRPAETGASFPVEIASDDVQVDLQHFDESCTQAAACTPAPASETVNVTWPVQGGGQGFYKTKAGKWVTTVDGTASVGATAVTVKYSTTPPGQDLEFKDCAGSEKSVETRTKDPKTKLFRNECMLNDADTPSAVTAVAAVSGSVDARVVAPYLQQPSEMSVSMTPLVRRTKAGSACQEVTAKVVDAFGRPVKGVNLDVQIQGPGDAAYFGQPSDSQPPEGAPTEPASSCAIGGTSGEQGVSVVALEGDIKQIETIQGPNFNGEWKFRVFSPESGMTGITAWVDDEDFVDDALAQTRDNDFLDDGEPYGEARRQWLDQVLGITIDPRNDTAPVGACNEYTVTAVAGDSVLPGINVDLHLRFPGDHLTFCDVGTNTPHRDPTAGEHPPANIGNSHRPDTPHCPDPGPKCRHVEGETDESGRFSIGLTSSVVGETPESAAGLARVTAWVDGEPGEDDDLRSTSEPITTATTNWVAIKGNAEIHLLNPVRNNSGGGNIGTSSVEVVARVDAPYLVDGVEILLGNTKLGNATRLHGTDTYVYEWDLNVPPGEAAPTPTPSASPTPGRPTPPPTPTPTPPPTPTPIVSPPPTVTPPATVSPPPTPAPVPSVNAPGRGVPDGNYTLKARIIGTGRSDEVGIAVNRNLSPSTDIAKNDATPPFEWARLDSPSNGTTISLANGWIPVSGLASAGAEGVYVYYATGGPRDALKWSSICGFVDLSGAGSADQTFDGGCSLAGTDSPADVVAVAVAAFDCTASGCDANPQPPPIPNTTATPPPPHGIIEAGTVTRIFACADSPCIAVHPREWLTDAGSCQEVVLTVGDTDGNPVRAQNVDVTVSGPTDTSSFCAVAESTPSLRAPYSADPATHVAGGGLYRVAPDPLGPDVISIEGETDDNGRLVFGISSRDSGYDSIYSIQQDGGSRLSAWVDVVDDDRRSAEEPSALASIAWDLPDRCTVVGTPEADVLAGSFHGTDKICGLGGDDTVYAFEGSDILVGGEGNDDLWGDEGDDSILGGSGDDVLHGNPGKDFLNGGPGADHCEDRKAVSRMEQCERFGRVPPP